MMSSLSYYLSIFRRRLHWFLLVATVISAVAVTLAASLPDAYVSRTQLIVEQAQIEGGTGQTLTPVQQLQIVQQQLMTRANLLDIARELEVFGSDQRAMSPDQIVQGMRGRTNMRTNTGRDEATFMSITFEAPTGRIAQGVLNEYLNLITQSDVEFRTGRAGQTLEFYQQQVDQLDERLAAASQRILEFKNANADALPESEQFRRSERSSLQDRIAQIERDQSGLTSQREQLVRVFEATGQLGSQGPDRRTPAQRQLDDTQEQLSTALTVFSETNPRVRQLQAQVTRLEERVAAEAGQAAADQPDGDSRARTMLDVQLAEIADREASLVQQKADLEVRVDALTDSLERIPSNRITLDALEREFANVQRQYNEATSRLANASTGERIETLSRGQRISIIDPPAVPTEPSKPDRVLIAGGGTVAGIGAGLGLIVLLELLNRSARRPDDLVRRLGVTPLATLPYIQSRREALWRRAVRVAVVLAILVGGPALVLAVHYYYMPLDLLAQKAMDALGVSL